MNIIVPPGCALKELHKTPPRCGGVGENKRILFLSKIGGMVGVQAALMPAQPPFPFSGDIKLRACKLPKAAVKVRIMGSV
jgi:hypothetical protein